MISFEDELFNKGNSKIFSNALRNYNVETPNKIKEFPFNLIYMNHSDKMYYLENDLSVLFNSYFPNTQSDFNVDLLSYFDSRIIEEKCSYTYENKIQKYFKLTNSILNTSCTPNISSDKKFQPLIYDNIFRSNVNKNTCKNKSIKNCNEQYCMFSPFYNKLKCIPKSNRDDKQAFPEENEMLRSQLDCSNLSNSECEANTFCQLVGDADQTGLFCISKEYS